MLHKYLGWDDGALNQLLKLYKAMDFLLDQVFTDSVPLENVIKWITNPDDAADEFRSLGFTAVDFSFYLLSYLRDQSSRILSQKTPLEIKNSSVTEGSTSKKENPHQNRKSSDRKSNTKSFTPPINKSPNAINIRHSPLENGDRSRNWRQNQPRTSPSNITFGNFIINSKSGSKHKKNKSRNSTENENRNLESTNEIPETKRRINPTRVVLKSDDSSKSQTNPFSNVEEIFQSDVINERNLLKKECLQVQKNELNSNVNAKTSKANPLLNNVTNKEKLDKLSEIYNCILNNDLVLNVMNELCFLIELIAVESVDESDNELLGTVHNCVYFGVTTLNLQKEIFQHLDATTVRYLYENERIKDFLPSLTEYLKNINNAIKRSISIQSSNTNGVAYETDTDDKQNFSNPQSFQLFRKHRDTFYNTLEKWDSERYFTNNLIKNIESIFKSQNLEPEFYVHFSKLLVSQMIASCVRESGSLPADKSSNLPELQVDPQRLRMLQERLVTPSKSSGGPCPAPEFTGWEEFFRDFVVLAASHQLQQHLQDAFVTKLLELNSKQFSPSELQDSDTCVDDETRSKFLVCALSAQLIAKFLGFFQFLPYRASQQATKKLPEHSITLQASHRREVCPILDTHHILIQADKKSRLTLTLPWLCSYLAQLDPVSLKLVIYQKTLTRMVQVSHGLSHRKNISKPARLLLKFSLGWCLGILVEISASVWEIARIQHSSISQIEVATGTLDCLDVVDSRTLFSLCPFLSELRGKLAGGGGGHSSRAPCAGSRHITPVAAVSKLDPAHQLELQMESCFLHTQPSSLRHTLEFVSERVSSLCTKHLTEHVLNEHSKSLHQQILEKVRQQAVSMQDLELDFPLMVTAIKDALSTWSKTLAESHCNKLHEMVTSQSQQFCSARCSATLVQLMPESCSEAQSEACVKICTRNACTKVHSWASIHLSPSEIEKQVTEELEKTAKMSCKPETPKNDPHYSNTLPPGGRDLKHNDMATSPADVLIHLRELVLFLQDGGKVERSHLTSAVEATEFAVASRADLIPSAHTSIQFLTVDLTIVTACYQAELLDTELISQLVSLWQGPLGRPISLDRLLCARNLHQVSVCASPQKTWRALRQLLAALIRTKLISPSCIEEQAVAVLQQEWPQNFLRYYTSCIEELVREVGKEIPSNEAASFSQLLKWLADFCCDLDDLM